MYHNEKIDYTAYLQGKQRETDSKKIYDMYMILSSALNERGVHGKLSAVYYTDGCVKVDIDGQYYGMFDTNTEKFFSQCVGDQPDK